ncbi:MAG: hypothetical protein ITG00_01545 [Flavobacterium sp.]|nr:hypothetical protein [Flavobacterium sp.]
MKKLFLLAVVAFTFSCSSDDSPGTNPPIVDPTDTEPTEIAFARGEMNGVAFDYTFNNAADDTFLHNSINGYSALDLDRWYYYGGMFMQLAPPNFTPEFSIAWDNVYFGQGGSSDGETEAFYESVSNLPTNYLTIAQDEEHLPGISVQFKNQQDVLYNSVYGSQTGSTVEILGSSESMAGGLKRKTVWGTISCKLYNSDNVADVIELTDGTFKMILTEYSN